MAGALINTMTWIFKDLLEFFVAALIRYQLETAIEGINSRTEKICPDQIQEFIGQFAADGFGIFQTLKNA